MKAVEGLLSITEHKRLLVDISLINQDYKNFLS